MTWLDCTSAERFGWRTGDETGRPVSRWPRFSGRVAGDLLRAAGAERFGSEMLGENFWRQDLQDLMANSMWKGMEM